MFQGLDEGLERIKIINTITGCFSLIRIGLAFMIEFHECKSFCDDS